MVILGGPVPPIRTPFSPNLVFIVASQVCSGTQSQHHSNRETGTAMYLVCSARSSRLSEIEATVHNLFEASTVHAVSLWSKLPWKCVTKYLTLLEITGAHLAFGFWRLIHARLGFKHFFRDDVNE